MAWEARRDVKHVGFIVGDVHRVRHEMLHATTIHIIVGYVDIHTHVLPGIDDGPASLEECLAMARAAADCGTATIAASPHLRADFPDVHVHELADRCQALREAIERDGILRLVSGAEVSVGWAAEATNERLALASYGQRGTDLLIETPTIKLVGIDRFLYTLQAKGYRVTLAHPERSLEFQRMRRRCGRWWTTACCSRSAPTRCGEPRAIPAPDASRDTS